MSVYFIIFAYFIYLKRCTQDSNLQSFSAQRFSRPLPHHPDMQRILLSLAVFMIDGTILSSTIYHLLHTFCFMFQQLNLYLYLFTKSSLSALLVSNGALSMSIVSCAFSLSLRNFLVIITITKPKQVIPAIAIITVFLMSLSVVVTVMIRSPVRLNTSTNIPSLSFTFQLSQS